MENNVFRIPLVDIIDGIEQIRQGSYKNCRIDLNSSLIENGVCEKDISLLLKVMLIVQRGCLDLKESGYTWETLSKMTLIEFWCFCEEHIKPKQDRQYGESRPGKATKHRRFFRFR